jgi:5-methylcytosine-specific restriction endonuclease McrA
VLKRKVDGAVVKVFSPDKPKVKKPVSWAVKLEHQRRAAKNKIIAENDAILRALALMRDGHCVVCGTTNHLQVSHIYAKGKYPEMRWLLDNVEIRCAGDHFYKKGSPHGDPAGFHEWLSHYPLTALYLQTQAARTDVKVTLEFIEQSNADLREQFFKAADSKWGE